MLNYNPIKYGTRNKKMKKLKKALACVLALCIAASAASAFSFAVSAAQSVGSLFISEVCFNPNYEALSSKVVSNNDYFEFVEIKNVGSSAIDMSDLTLNYSKEGASSSTWYKDSVVFDSENTKTMNPGDVWVIGVYTIATPVLGLGYSTDSELKNYWNAFNKYYGVTTYASKRALAVASPSKQESWLSGSTSLPNSGTNGALRFVSAAGTLATVSYAPDTYSQDGYALQNEYTGSSLNILGISGPTPGTVNYSQLPSSRPAASGTSVNLVSLNVCYDINGVTPANGSASDYSVEKREKRVTDWLSRTSADIICLSEISAPWWSSINSVLTSRGFALSGNYSCYGMTDGAAHERATDSYNPVFYNREKYTKIDEGHFWLLESTPSVGNKICNWVLLKNNSDSTVFCLFNTHLSANDSGSSTNFTARYNETERLGSQISSTLSGLGSKYKSVPYIVSGDFNINEQSPLYRELLKVTKTSDQKFIARNSATKATFNNWGNYTESNGTVIDFVLGSNGVDCSTYNTVNVTGSDGYLASDHAAVIVNLAVNASSSGGSNSGFDIGDFDFSSILGWIKTIINIIKAIITFVREIASSTQG